MVKYTQNIKTQSNKMGRERQNSWNIINHHCQWWDEAWEATIPASALKATATDRNALVSPCCRELQKQNTTAMWQVNSVDLLRHKRSSMWH